MSEPALEDGAHVALHAVNVVGASHNRVTPEEHGRETLEIRDEPTVSRE